MNDFDLYLVAQRRLEILWREAEWRARIFAAAGDVAADADTVRSREYGSRV